MDFIHLIYTESSFKTKYLLCFCFILRKFFHKFPIHSIVLIYHSLVKTKLNTSYRFKLMVEIKVSLAYIFLHSSFKNLHHEKVSSSNCNRIKHVWNYQWSELPTKFLFFTRLLELQHNSSHFAAILFNNPELFFAR